jgi:hypothetical protein
MFRLIAIVPSVIRIAMVNLLTGRSGNQDQTKDQRAAICVW